MTFAQPYWLIAGVAACALLAWRYRKFNQQQQAALTTFASSHLAERLTQSVSPGRRALKRALVVAGVALLFLALARPQAGFRWEEARRNGLDILFAVDTSKSMLAQDVKPDRLTRAKLAVNDLLDKLNGDAVGLVAFAGGSFLQSPITLDYDAFRETLNALDTSIIPRGGTDIAAAVREARAAFRSQADREKILILITDGEDLEGNAVAAAEAAGKDGVKIFTVGVGSTNGELIPVPTADGGTEFARDDSGQFVKSKLDETMLKKIAEVTGGMYQPLGSRGEGLTAIYDKGLAPFARHEVASRKSRIAIERFEWPLAGALGCFVIEMLIGTRRWSARKISNVTGPSRATLSNTPLQWGATNAEKKETVSTVSMPPQKPLKRFSSSPSTNTPLKWGVNESNRSGQAKVAATATTALALIVWPALTHASPQSAEKAYQKGDFVAAQQQYEAAAAKAPANAKLHFNAGSAAYKAAEFDKAAAAFQGSLKTDQVKLQQDTYYNLGNTQYRQGQRTEKNAPQETIKTWEEAIKSYEAALQLKPDDADAKYNRDLVKKKLEELKKQQEQKKNDQQNQDQKKQDQKDQQQNQQDQSKQDQQKQDQKDRGKQDQAQNGSDKQDKDQKDQGQDKKNPDQKQQAGNQPQPAQPNEKDQAGVKPDKSGDQEAAAQPAPGKMSKEEAKNLLDSLKGDDKRMPAVPLSRNGGKFEDAPVKKDW